MHPFSDKLYVLSETMTQKSHLPKKYGNRDVSLPPLTASCGEGEVTPDSPCLGGEGLTSSTSSQVTTAAITSTKAAASF